MPILTIGVLCRNHEPYVERCLESIRLAEGSRDFQVIVVDNASTDCSAARIEAYIRTHRLRWQFVSTSHNIGGPAGWNIALQNSSARFFVAASTDDYFDSQRFVLQVERLEGCATNVVMAGGEVQKVDANGDPIGALREFRACIEPASALQLKLSGEAPVSISQTWRTDFLRSVGGFDQRFHTEDVPIEWKACELPGAQFVYVPKSRTFYRLHGANNSAHLNAALGTEMYRRLAEELNLPDEARKHLERLADQMSDAAFYQEALLALAEEAQGARLLALRRTASFRMPLRARLNLAYLAISPWGHRRAQRRYRRFVRSNPPTD
jgi:glycosyltransferase involved in cell wall biosynthesis